MRAGKNPITGEAEVYMTEAEAEQMKEMVRGASLPHRRMFNVILTEL